MGSYKDTVKVHIICDKKCNDSLLPVVVIKITTVYKNSVKAQ